MLEAEFEDDVLAVVRRCFADLMLFQIPRKSICNEVPVLV